MYSNANEKKKLLDITSDINSEVILVKISLQHRSLIFYLR